MTDIESTQQSSSRPRSLVPGRWFCLALDAALAVVIVIVTILE